MCLPASEAKRRTAPFGPVRAPEPLQRRPTRNVVLAPAVEQALAHPAREEARCDGVDGDAVDAPLGSERAREIDARALAGVVGDGLHLDRVAAQPGDGSDVDDAAASLRDHARPRCALAE